MSRVAELLRSRRVPQIAVLTLMSVGFAGCSADMSTRFSQNTLSNPFNYQPEATGTVQAPTPQVERRELPQYSRPQNPLPTPLNSRPEARGRVQAPPPQVERRELPQYSRPQTQQYQSSALPPP